MCDRLKEMTQRVNTVMGRNYNTILMNVYKDNKDCFAAHQDNENGWVKGTGFGTLAFGCERPFVIREIATKDKEKIIHKSPYRWAWYERVYIVISTLKKQFLRVVMV